MTKKEFVTALAEKTGFTKKDSEIFLGAFVEAVGDALEQGEDIKLVGFGAFTTREVEERIRRNPRTNEEITCPAHRTVKFKIGKELKERVR